MDISNGEGVGIALFVQGCDFHCKGCFNSETWDFDGGKDWDIAKGRVFFDLANRTYVTRISILGGEPLHDKNILAVGDLCVKLKENFPEKKIWLYTGYTLEDIKNDDKVTLDELNIFKVSRFNLLRYIDVLVDGQYVESLKDITYPWAGSTNQRVINVQETLKQQKTVLYNG
ncbi:anaerobic ribonucleoside-triphosphate reductase activating protein [Lachnospiraceae bacterium NSJ-143]|nr:anaerobic ribonucleoside-triphosphate reductase activating protein [Lachnospiraceae bacterium NSJ-143]